MKRIVLIFLSLIVVGCSQEKEIVVDTTDPYIWLEEVEGVDALNWVKEQNEITYNAIAKQTNKSHVRSSPARRAPPAEPDE